MRIDIYIPGIHIYLCARFRFFSFLSPTGARILFITILVVNTSALEHFAAICRSPFFVDGTGTLYPMGYIELSGRIDHGRPGAMRTTVKKASPV